MYGVNSLQPNRTLADSHSLRGKHLRFPSSNSVATQSLRSFSCKVNLNYTMFLSALIIYLFCVHMYTACLIQKKNSMHFQQPTCTLNQTRSLTVGIIVWCLCKHSLNSITENMLTSFALRYNEIYEVHIFELRY